jgi:hypothetical protein
MKDTYAQDRFTKITIKKCAICEMTNAQGYKEGVTEDLGIGILHRAQEFCEKCFEENTFTNSYGFTFLKFDDRLFCYKPFYYLDFGFRQVTSDTEIERAFNPEYYEFLKWLNN